MEGLESFFTATEQLRLFLLSCLFGVPIGIAFDIFRVFRLLVPHGKIAVALEDALFFVLYAIFVMCFTTAAARSEFRFYFIAGNLLGFTVYHLTLGNLVTGALKRVILFLKKVLGRLFSPLFKKIVLICEKWGNFFVGNLQNRKKSKKINETDLIDNGDLLYNNKKEK